MVIVPDYQLSLAIGKEGQNARLAARLTGWRIDIKSETQVAEEPRPAAPARRGHRSGVERACAADGARRRRGGRTGCGRGLRSRRSRRPAEPVVADPAEAPAEA